MADPSSRGTALAATPPRAEAAARQVPVQLTEEVRARFAAYYAQHATALVRHIMRYGVAPNEAADAVQSAFIAAYPLWETIEHHKAWLRTTAFRCYLRQVRSRREDLTDAPPELPDLLCPLAAVELKDEERRVYDALAALPLKQRQAMTWTLDGFSAPEIAAELHISAAAVRQNLARARAALKQQLLTAGGAE